MTEPSDAPPRRAELRADRRATRAAARGGSDPRRAHARRVLVRTVVGVLAAAALIVGGPWVYARMIAGDQPDPLALSSPSPTTEAEVPTGPVDVDGTWTVQPGSEAGYRLREVLSGEEVVVVGRTDQVTGTATVSDGRLVEARVVVDAGSISTDEAARDAFFRRALDTTSFPEATFELSEPVDVSALRTSSQPVSVTATGVLTLHGVAQTVTVSLEAQRAPGGTEVVGQVPVTLADFDLTAPDLGWVVVDPAGTIELRLLLAR